MTTVRRWGPIYLDSHQLHVTLSLLRNVLNQTDAQSLQAWIAGMTSEEIEVLWEVVRKLEWLARAAALPAKAGRK